MQWRAIYSAMNGAWTDFQAPGTVELPTYLIEVREKPKYEPGWYWTVKDQYGVDVTLENRCVEWYTQDDLDKLGNVELEQVADPTPLKDVL